MDKKKSLLPAPSLREKEERFRTAQELSLDGFAILRAIRGEGKITDFEWDYINPAALRMLKIKDPAGQRLRQTLPAFEKGGLLSDFIRVVETGEAQSGEIAYQTEKTSGWFYVTAVRLGDGVAVSLREITERKRWEESLKQSEARFRVIAQSNMVGLLFWDEKGVILDVNPAFLQLIGHTREEFFRQSRSWQDLTPAEFWDLDQKAMAELRESGSCRPFEKELYHQSGQRVPVLIGAARLEAINYEGVAFVVDISERKTIEKEREILLGHELKTPLAGIKSFAQLLKERFEKANDKSTVYYLTKIDGKVDLLAQMINDLTDFTRIRSNQLEFKDEVFSFDELVKEVVADQQSLTKTHQIKLKGKTSKLVLADRTRLSQVLNNLLSNAVKYSPQADKVEVKLSCLNKEICVGIQDFGLGIPKTEQEKMFQPFFRVEKSKKLVPGVGLGLHIANEIVKHYGGRIDLESEADQGSTFTVVLPKLIP